MRFNYLYLSYFLILRAIHFIFKYESDNGGLKRKFQGLDLFNNTWGIAEWLDSKINYKDLQTINNETVEHIIRLFLKKE